LVEKEHQHHKNGMTNKRPIKPQHMRSNDTRLLAILIMSISMLMVVQTYVNLELLKYSLMVMVMLYACYEDILTKTVSRSIHILIIIIGCIGITPAYLQNEAVLGLLFAPLPFIITNVICWLILKKQVIGKGDIFYIGALGFAVGWSIVIPGLIIGLGVSMIYFCLKRTKDQTIAFIPIITMGVLMSVVINYQ